MPNNFKKSVVFGVFDGFHEGHRFFLQEAGRRAEMSIAVVARDSVVKLLKDKTPLEPEDVRLARVRASGCVSGAFLGDEELGQYSVIKEIKPDLVCLGHDQNVLRKDIEEKMGVGILPLMTLVVIEAYFPEKYCSSILNERRYG